MEQDEVFKEIYNAVLTVLSHDSDGSIKKLLETIVEWENQNPPKDKYHGFAWHEVFGDPRTLNSLVTRRILKIVFKSNKYVAYRALDLKAMEKALADFEGSFIQEEVAESIPSNLFEVVIGHKDKKDLILRGLQSKKPVHYLLWGSVASAKTLMLEELARLPRSRLILGSALTRAGIFDVLFNERPRYLIIDEMEKIDSIENLSALLSLMERGFVTETKYRRHRTIRLKTWVFGSANDITRLPRELLSRFTLLRFRDYTPEEFYEVTVNVLSQREGISDRLALYIAEKVLKILQSRDVRDAIKCARLLKEHTKEDVDHVIQVLAKQR